MGSEEVRRGQLKSRARINWALEHQGANQLLAVDMLITDLPFGAVSSYQRACCWYVSWNCSQ
jgi:hypothetical protein